jgi:hypothetical protein
MKGRPGFKCPHKDKETGMVAFNFNVGEVKVTKNPEQDVGWKTWQWGEIVKEEKVNISNAYKTCIMIDNDNKDEKRKDDHESISRTLQERLGQELY